MSTSPKLLILFDEESMFVNFLRTAREYCRPSWMATHRRRRCARKATLVISVATFERIMRK